MNKLLRTILITLITVFGIGVLSIDSVQAQTPSNIVVEIWKVDHFELLGGKSIFDVSNFVPGDEKTETIRVTNNTSENQTVGLKVINFNKGCVGSYCLADKLYLTVGKVGNSSLYTGSLTAFYGAGEIPLSQVGADGRVEYNLSVYFDKETAAKEYQGLITKFDLEIGFFTKETVSPEQPTGYGGYVPPIAGVVTAITIDSLIVTPDSATISLTADIPSYCRVIYDITSHPTLGNPPNYGYAFSTVPSDTKTTFHNITLTGLSSGTTYYYRAVCWASPLKISREYSFTTLEVKVEKLIPPEEEMVPPEEVLTEEEIIVPEEIVRGPEELIEEKAPEKVVGEEREEIVKEEIEKPVEKKPLGEIFASEGLLAAIGAMPLNLKIILIIAGIIIIGLIILWLIRKRRKKKLV